MSYKFWVLGIISAGVIFSAVGYRIGSQTREPEKVKYEVVSKAVPSPQATPVSYMYCRNPNCGTISIPKDLCSDTVGYVCCYINHKWIWYASRDACKVDQGQENNPSPAPK